MLLERFDDKGRQENAAAALVGLWLCFHIPFARQFTRYTSQDAAYLKRTALEINVLPLEADEFAPSQTTCKRKDKERLQSMTASHSQKLLYLLQAQGLNL